MQLQVPAGASSTLRMASSTTSGTRKQGADYVFVVRHAERLDRENPKWGEGATRPQDSPLSQQGKKQAERLGKWLYGCLPVHTPVAIFCSPFIRCVQTADAIATELEGLQQEGVHASSATRICIEPGLSEDMSAEGYALRAAQEEERKGGDTSRTASRSLKLKHSSLQVREVQRASFTCNCWLLTVITVCV
jgi:hypothetical protein